MSAQTVLVTGSSSGMGLELTRGLLNRGYTVFATMRNIEGANADQAAQLRSYAREQSGTLHLVELDVTDDNSVTNAINHVVQEAGKLDVVINNAGIGVAAIPKPLPSSNSKTSLTSTCSVSSASCVPSSQRSASSVLA